MKDLQLGILEEFAEAQEALRVRNEESSAIRRARKLQQQRKRQMMHAKIQRGLDKFLRTRVPKIAPLPFVPMHLRRDPRCLGKGSGATL